MNEHDKFCASHKDWPDPGPEATYECDCGAKDSIPCEFCGWSPVATEGGYCCEKQEAKNREGA